MGSKSQSTSQVQLTQEQKDQLAAQTDLLKRVLIPNYETTIGGADTARQTAYGIAGGAVPNAQNVSANVQEQLGNQGQEALNEGYTGTSGLSGFQGNFGAEQQLAGTAGLSNLFSDDYKQEQIRSALQPVQEQVRDQYNANNASYGGTGQLGSARDALARANIGSLAEQRLGTVSAGVNADIENRKQAAANAILQAGQVNTQGAQQGYQNLTSSGTAGILGAQDAAGKQIGYSSVPQDIYNRYASVLFGTPGGGGSNFSGTQGVSSSSKGLKFADGGIVKRSR